MSTNREELNPVENPLEPDLLAAGDAQTPPPPGLKKVDDPDIQERLAALVRETGGLSPESFEGRLIRDLLSASLKLVPDGRNSGELKLITATVKELRYAMRVFAGYAEPHKVTIFGSARTPPEHPDYEAAKEFGALMAKAGWMVITGAGDGIMKAGHEGPGREASFGVAIRLPFETSANTVIAGDSKLINFRYFFTRKLMFLSQAEAVVCFPGGFGTLDEAYEALTLIQTGKASMVPVVLCEGAGGDYWKRFMAFVRDPLLSRGLISPEDENLVYLAPTPAAAHDHVVKFYRIYHSSRYVKEDLVIRLRRRLKESEVERLNEEFAVLVKKGRIVQCGPYEIEGEHLDLPRLAFTHTRYKYGLVRRLIDRINECEGEP
jgi:uncharacterized protein (TIGR00730 family)